METGTAMIRGVCFDNIFKFPYNFHVSVITAVSFMLNKMYSTSNFFSFLVDCRTSIQM